LEAHGLVFSAKKMPKGYDPSDYHFYRRFTGFKKSEFLFLPITDPPRAAENILHDIICMYNQFI